MPLCASHHPSTAQHSTAQHSTAQNSTAQLCCTVLCSIRTSHAFIRNWRVRAIFVSLSVVRNRRRCTPAAPPAAPPSPPQSARRHRRRRCYTAVQGQFESKPTVVPPVA
eukprot:gene23809-biopygen7336